MFKFFKKNVTNVEKVNSFPLKVAEGFSRIKQELVVSDQKFRNTSQELDRINKWINYLHNSQQTTNTNHLRLSDKHKNLSDKHSKLEKDHLNHSRTTDLKHNAVSAEMNALSNIASKDLSNMKEWITYFSKKIESYRYSEHKISQDISSLNQQLTNGFEKFSKEINELREENHALKSMLVKAKSTPVPVQTTILRPKIPINENKFEKHVLSKVRTNRKGMILSRILEFAQDGKHSTKDIEEIIVNEKQLCGRTSFYAYLKELRNTGKVKNVEVGDRIVLLIS